MNEELKKAVLEVLREHLVISLDMDSSFEGDNRYVTANLTVSFDGYDLVSESASACIG